MRNLWKYSVPLSFLTGISAALLADLSPEMKATGSMLAISSFASAMVSIWSLLEWAT